MNDETLQHPLVILQLDYFHSVHSVTSHRHTYLRYYYYTTQIVRMKCKHCNTNVVDNDDLQIHLTVSCPAVATFGEGENTEGMSLMLFVMIRAAQGYDVYFLQ